ncbi:pectinesterase family protein [Streptomyces sp. NBC_00391]|uniref:pectinesterase family protein n=1 Tax=Streptomyces sp. NBC_00391 TaxID=2903647 RepID=UPI002E1E3C39
MTSTTRDGLPRRSFLAAATAVAATSVLATGLGIASAPRAVAAAGSNVTWRISSEPAEAKAGYVKMINDITSHVRSHRVTPRDGVRPVSVTDENGENQFTTIDLHAESSSRFIRIFMRQSDAYILGWRIGDEANSDPLTTFFTLEAGVNLPGAIRTGTGLNVDPRHEGMATYTELERNGRISRVGLQITPAQLNNAVLALYDGARRPIQEVAQSLLRIIVALAEGSRFVNQAAATATAFGNGVAYTVTDTHAAQHNSWLDLSRQFFDWLAVNWRSSVAYPPALLGLMMVHHSGRGSVHRDELREETTRYVAKDGFADDTTVQDAIDMVDIAGGDGGHRIIIDKGLYHEAIEVPSDMSFLTMESLSGNRADVVIYNTRCHGMIDPATGMKYGTQNSAVATFKAPNLIVKNLTIQNTFDRSAHPEISPYETQAVAVAARGDRQIFHNVAIMSHQDTLYVKGETPTTQARQYFVNCFVRGDVDFIFGNATAVIDRSTIQALAWPGGSVMAPSTDSSKKYGILINGCTISTAGVPSDSMYLGRPWHNTLTASPQAVVRNSDIQSGIKDAQPWTDMVPDYPWQKARFREYQNVGAGAGQGANAPKMSDAEAADFTVAKYLAGSDGWTPSW